jgi:hypothetical protein
MASLAFYHFEDHRHRGRIVLCFVGFLVAMVWILMIVTEVVGILQVGNFLPQISSESLTRVFGRLSDTSLVSRTLSWD